MEKFELVFMAQEKWAGFSATQKINMWCRSKARQSLCEIGRAFGKGHSSIRQASDQKIYGIVLPRYSCTLWTRFIVFPLGCSLGGVAG
jgi:hypothetical protein